jgi:hypothetical protein
MSKDNYREYLRTNYKSAKEELIKGSKPHTKKDVYGLLRSRFYDKKDEVMSGIKDPNPTVTSSANSEAPKQAVTTNQKPKLNLKAFAELYKKVIKL